MHDAFHVSQLKLTVGYSGSDANEAGTPAFHPAADESGEYEVEDILDHCSRRCGHLLCMEYLVRWRGYSVFESTWEPEDNLTNCARTLASYQQCRGLR